MKSLNQSPQDILVAGASIAGLTAAYWLTQAGHRVTVVELAAAPRLGGAAVNLHGEALAWAGRMGILEILQAHRLQVERWDFKNADDVTVGTMLLQGDGAAPADEDLEVERGWLVSVLLEAVQDKVEWRFNDRITALHETADAVQVTFAASPAREFELVIGGDGLHSGVRKLWFGPATDYVQFLHYYFSLTTISRRLLPANTTQLYNVPGKLVMLNAYQDKTDIVFSFFAEHEIPYDYRSAGRQRQLLLEQFTGQGWRTDDLLAEVQQADISYFDKLCQVRMPAWTKGRVALVGDAAYCASPAAGMGASLALLGASTLVEALVSHAGDFNAAFAAYNQQLRPFIEEVQATALATLHDYLVPGTAEAIQARNQQGVPL